MLINCIYMNVLACFLKLLMVLIFQTDQHENYLPVCFVTVSERSSHWRFSSRPCPTNYQAESLCSKSLVNTRSSILLKLHIYNLELYQKLNYIVSILQLLLVQVQASILWNTFWWQLLSIIPNKKLTYFWKKNLYLN